MSDSQNGDKRAVKQPAANPETEIETEPEPSLETETSPEPEPSSDTETSSETSPDKPQTADSAHPKIELEIMAPLWELVMQKPDLPADLQRRLAPFKKFQQRPEKSLEIVRNALNTDEELRDSMVKLLMKDDPDTEMRLADVDGADEPDADKPGADKGEAADESKSASKTSTSKTSADKPSSDKPSPEDLMREQFPMLMQLWLLRPGGWREVLDSLLILHSQLQHFEGDNARMKAELGRAKDNPQKAKDKASQTRDDNKRLKSLLQKEKSDKSAAENRVKELEEKLTEAQQEKHHLQGQLKSEDDELESSRRHYEKLQKENTQKTLEIQRLEREIRQLKLAQSSQGKKKQKERRTGFKRKEPEVNLEPRQPIVPPPGTNSFSKTAAYHYMQQAEIIIIDGYNFILTARREETKHLHTQQRSNRPAPNSAGGKLELEVYRNQLRDGCIQMFATYKSHRLEMVSIIFDGNYPAPGSPLSPQGGVEEYFTHDGQIADDQIVERIQQYPSFKTVVVVTNDDELRDRCQRLGATIMTDTQLLYVIGNWK